MTQQEVRGRLMVLYQEMSDHTKDHCDKCKGPSSCCHGSVCSLVVTEAWFKWKVELVPTGHPKLPLMGDTGCTADPHLRPLCTVHSCCIAKFGGDPNDPIWTERYWILRDELTDLELRLNVFG